MQVRPPPGTFDLHAAMRKCLQDQRKPWCISEVFFDRFTSFRDFPYLTGHRRTIGRIGDRLIFRVGCSLRPKLALVQASADCLRFPFKHGHCGCGCLSATSESMRVPPLPFGFVLVSVTFFASCHDQISDCAMTSSATHLTLP